MSAHQTPKTYQAIVFKDNKVKPSVDRPRIERQSNIVPVAL
ncbi:MAG: hypothetical protein AB9Q23_10920 [Candidatus Reddybacter sp.]